MRYVGVGFLALALVALAASTFLAPQPVAHAQDPAKPSFSDLKKAYNEAKKSSGITAMARAVNDMGNSGDPEAAEFLLKELDWDQKQRKSKRPGLPGDIRKRIIVGLGKFSDSASVKRIGDAAVGLDSSPGRDPSLALDQFDFFRALAEMSNSAEADNAIRTAIANPKNPYIKIAALEAVRQAEGKRFAPDVLKVLYEDNREWSDKWTIVPINVLACLEKIVKREDTQGVIAVVEAVIAWEERRWCLDDRVRFMGGKMLRQLTGESADMGSTPFWKWWVAQMKLVGKVDTTNMKPPERASKTAATPPVFDAQPVGRRFVFVIDVSDSMKLPLKITLEDMRKRRKEREGPVTGRGPKPEEEKKEGEAGPDPEESGIDPDDPLAKLPWKDIKTKIDLAREELSRSISNLRGDREFAIITYSQEVQLMTSGWIKATPGNCDEWARKARGLEPESLTNIHGSLMMAMRLSSKGVNATEPSVDQDCVLTGADTIIFLTDGWATWDDQSNAQNVPDPRGGSGRVGDGPFILGKDIWPDILRHNIFRKVVISAVGIGHHDKELLRNLARETGGVYVDWGFPEE